MKSFSLYVFLTLMLISCELTIDIEQPDFDASLVVQTNLNNHEPLLLFLSQDYYILDRALENYSDGNGLSGADISVFENGEFIGLMENYPFNNSFQGGTIDGFYSLECRPQSGSTYRFEMEKEGFTKAIGETKIPLETFQYEIEEINESINEWGGTDYRIELSIDDPEGPNYYEVEVMQHTFQPVFDDFENVVAFLPITQGVYIRSENIVIPEYQYDRLLFKDELFDGKSFRFNFSADFYLENSLKEEYGLTEDSHVVVKIRSCSEEYFNYYNTAALQNWNDGDPLVEPVPIFTNVQNGFGLVGSYFERVDTIFTY
ncbi:MAG: DUF4249 domain-containing protein [Cyclobacteriaceae bacterium]